MYACSLCMYSAVGLAYEIIALRCEECSVSFDVYICTECVGKPLLPILIRHRETHKSKFTNVQCKGCGRVYYTSSEVKDINKLGPCIYANCDKSGFTNEITTKVPDGATINAIGLMAEEDKLQETRSL